VYRGLEEDVVARGYSPKSKLFVRHIEFQVGLGLRVR
jgi:hypothetical protein